jgi:hypothetical protein
MALLFKYQHINTVINIETYFKHLFIINYFYHV